MLLRGAATPYDLMSPSAMYLDGPAKVVVRNAMRSCLYTKAHLSTALNLFPSDFKRASLRIRNMFQPKLGLDFVFPLKHIIDLCEIISSLCDSFWVSFRAVALLKVSSLSK